MRIYIAYMISGGGKGLFWDCGIGQNKLGFGGFGNSYLGDFSPFISFIYTKLVNSYFGIWQFLFWDCGIWTPSLLPSYMISYKVDRFNMQTAVMKD